ncbi:uncharacterized protein GVI51_D06127 [Nakaseomyces glabratus]|nr:hypothetical protein J7293_00930 [Nakaseomyces glabratus]KAH7608530.1 hypothetical protein J7294_00929 [Nakaseomyces glabratus]KAJ9569859.1 hypothetical protein LTX96_0003838 [Nakaseomyces glabratus]KTA99408.1 Uncharacterized protein AO439_000903 [Nakaseomyces glabratus]KTB00686.1 Uncharacterized protein AO440_000863 [Nakaseomyces glabratus]
MLRSILASRAAFRSRYAGVMRTLPCVRVTQRAYAQSWDNRYNNDKVDAHIKVQQLMDQIHANPAVMEKLEKVSKIMIEKNLINSDNHDANGQRSFKPMQMIKILMDKDLRLAMNEFKSSLDKAGIQLGPDQLAPLMTVLGIEKEKK